jgi:Flp pilus assembly protein TadG
MMHGQRGSSMVEFAIAAGALLLVMFGIVEFGRALYYYHTVSNAARIASRWAEVRGSRCTAPVDHCDADSGDIQGYIASTVPLLDGNNLTVNATWSTSTDPGVDCSAGTPLGNNDPGHFVCVTVVYRFDLAIPFFNGRPIRLTSTSKEAIAD